MNYTKAQIQLDDEYANLFFDITEVDDALNVYLKSDTRKEYYDKYDILVEKIKDKYELTENINAKCFQELKTKQEIETETNDKINSKKIEIQKLQTKIEKAEKTILKDKQKLEKLKSSYI